MFVESSVKRVTFACFILFPLFLPNFLSDLSFIGGNTQRKLPWLGVRSA